MKPVQRAIASLTSVALAVGSPMVFAAPALAVACGTGTYAGGDGTALVPYRIANAINLDELRDKSTDWACEFQQTSDIDMTGIVWRTNDAPNQSGIGNVGTKFTGTFNGGQFAISNLTIDGTVNTHAEPLGLFGYIDGGTVTGVNVSGTVTSNHPFVGGLAGQVSSTIIEDSRSSVNVSGDYEIGGLVGYVSVGTGSTIRNSSASGNVVGTDVGALVASVGGLVGHVQGNSTVIENSFASGNVTSNSREFLGGLVGRSGSGVTIRRSFATGSVNAPNASSAARSAGGLVGSADGTTLEDVFATGTVSVNNGEYVGGSVGKLRNSGGITRAYSTGLVTGTTSVVKGGFDGDNFSLPVTASLWDTETSGLAASYGGPGVKGKPTAQMTTIATYTDDTAGWNWNSGGAQRITAGYDPAYTWGICSAVNNGYPFLTAFYSSDPCTGVTPVTPGASAPTYTFTFLTSGGGKCLPDVTVTRFERFTLPPASVACTPLGTSIAGWSIPGQDWAFRPGGVVTVVDSQVFTAVARNPEITITYDSNVNMGDECLTNNQNITREEDRWKTVDTPRVGPAASLGRSAPCSPPGFVLIGWTDANTPEGSGQAQQGAQTYEPDAAIPDSWNLETTNPVNSIRLYALWGRSVT